MILNDFCDIEYQEAFSEEPLSIFHFDDGISGVIFNLKATPTGTYLLDAYSIHSIRQKTKITKILNNMGSYARPSIYYSSQNNIAPDVYGCIKKIRNTDDKIIGYGDCSLYRFDDKIKRYVLTQKMTIDTPPDIPKGKYHHTQTRRALEKCLREHKCHMW